MRYSLVMDNKLENLVNEAESEIQTKRVQVKNQPRAALHLPKISIAGAIWLLAILIAATQFDTVVKIVVGPTESKIESDLGNVLSTAARSVRTYRINNGDLPMLLPNPAIRGLVKYEQKSSDDFRLQATISKVTMVIEPPSYKPYRKEL